MQRIFLVAFLLAVLVSGATFAQGRRVALVVGNNSYRSVERLANPANDARLIAGTLQAAGFTLVGGGPQIDLDKGRFDRAVQEFGRAIQGADVALFYYSGHGMQVNGVNWLVPVDANPSGARDLDFQMVDTSLVLRQMEGAGTKLNLVLLDACRNNPFAVRGIRATGGGLAEMQAPEGTLISYATQPGNVAADGAGQDSPYTVAVVNAMRAPGMDIFRVFNQVGLSVKQATGGQQQPWLASSPIAGTFYFFNGPVSVTLSQVAMPQAPPSAPRGPASSDRFDGVWSVAQACSTISDARGYHFSYLARVVHGALSALRGQPGMPGSLQLDGPIDADGAAQLILRGITNEPVYTIGNMPRGTPYGYAVNAHFGATTGQGKRTSKRPCTFEFTRQ